MIIENLVKALVDGTDEANPSLSISEYLKANYPVTTVWDRSLECYNLRRKVCETLRDARLVLEESGNSIGTRIAALKHARRTLEVIFSAYRKKQEIWSIRGEEVSTLVLDCTLVYTDSD
jgi:hypothetical protein